jgi:hypothetical protein
MCIAAVEMALAKKEEAAAASKQNTIVSPLNLMRMTSSLPVKGIKGEEQSEEGEE